MAVKSIRELAAVVRGRRKDLGLNQAELAWRAGVSRKWVYEFEGGKPAAEVGVLLRVLDELDLDLDLSVRREPPAGPDGGIDLDAIIEEHRGDGR